MRSLLNWSVEPPDKKCERFRTLLPPCLSVILQIQIVLINRRMEAIEMGLTLYKEQWLKLLDMSPEIRNFIAENEAQLKTKE